MNEEELFAIRHSTAHILAAALTELHPGIKLGVGPVIDAGFYYDVQLPDGVMLSDDDLKKVRKKMIEIVNRGDDFVKEELEVDDAIAMFTKMGQDFKVELLQELKTKGTTEVYGDEEIASPAARNDVGDVGAESISIYKTGDFVDLCRGPHVASSKEIGAFKLHKLAGAYWRGDEKNPMLQRVYGFAFATKEELAKHEEMLRQAARRDHRKLGKELDLFVFSDLVGPGLPLWTPRGTQIRNLLDDFVWEMRKERGYDKVEIPHITKKDLYETSGHWEKFSDELFKITTREGHEFAMKPMNCPHHTQIFDSRQRSYRDMPLRYATTTMCYRDEQTGELHGLSRTRAFAQDDAHVFCRESQIKEEALKIWDIIDSFYKAFNFDLQTTLSFHDPNEMEKYLGTPEVWKKAEATMTEIAQERGVEAKVEIGEAAFYGPKIDFKAIDSIGREWQVATIQLDMNMPERFDLHCINEKSEEERIFMIHAAIMGSITRFMSVMIEHVAGAFPLWLSPVQVAIASVSENHVAYCNELAGRLRDASIRVYLDDSNESVGKKIRNAAQQKYPYTLVVGDKEANSDKLAIRVRGKEDLLELSEIEFIEKVTQDSKNRTFEL
ncbi:MAG: threonine--tRNA ligase [Parcubacteria group bacterium]|nr:threonine--tRNA ligase [Parcubacteria group bacterium]|tara:strand:- start:2328 stop:4154 length:1827 start_codon:yes stop_codon:yes gene_type:complete